mgnify:CR=1 FL=1|jgi:hypothetical protein
MYDLASLLSQLGLSDDPEGIRRFIHHHAPLGPRMRIEEAPFWTPVQADVLSACWLEDADWCSAFDELNLALSSDPEDVS